MQGKPGPWLWGGEGVVGRRKATGPSPELRGRAQALQPFAAAGEASPFPHGEWHRRACSSGSLGTVVLGPDCEAC